MKNSFWSIISNVKYFHIFLYGSINENKSGQDLSFLLTGKFTLEYLDEIKVLIDSGLAVNAKHITGAYRENNNDNKTVDFIINSLK
ncbi:MAG: DUF1704 domain-containing protein [Flavobacteriales bacterium]|nr:DUF1704 domain-containing protein [Flavobacteriales bacterium]